MRDYVPFKEYYSVTTKECNKCHCIIRYDNLYQCKNCGDIFCGHCIETHKCTSSLKTIIITISIIIAIISCVSIFAFGSTNDDTYVYNDTSYKTTQTVIPITFTPVPTITRVSLPPPPPPTIIAPSYTINPPYEITPIPRYTYSVTSTIRSYTTIKTQSFKYVLHGTSGTINLKLDSDTESKISNQEYPTACLRYSYDNSPCTEEELNNYYLEFINSPLQKPYLNTLVNEIKSKTGDKDDQARIAISLVQNIPYGDVTGDTQLYPYEVLYYNKGVCSDKSLLLSYLLRELGYGVVLFEFEQENHMTIGIKSSDKYDYKDTGYAFVETTDPTIITFSQGEYGRYRTKTLTSNPIVYDINRNGISFSSMYEEYNDALEYNDLYYDDTILPPDKYRRWEILMWKYGLMFENGTTITENPSNQPVCDGNRMCNGDCWKACEPGTYWVCTYNGAECRYS